MAKSLAEQTVLILDTQTTGTSAARDRLLEIGWACTSALAPFPPNTHGILVAQPEPLPRKAQEITGILPEELALAELPESAWQKFNTAMEKCAEDSSLVSLAHYAQFERPFLQKFYEHHGAGKIFPLPLFCTYKIAKRLFPEAPSRNIRGLAGFLGCEISHLRRAPDHVLATALIWRRIAQELDAIGVGSMAALEAWLSEKPAPKKSSPQFRVDRLKRLQLPKGPGIYRMLSKNGEILYVGKATSLKSRVNSYFRGGCAGDSRKLEMLARVFDIEVIECDSPLEAALLENEEIKKHSPHYNRALKPSSRSLAFFSRDFTQASLVQDAEHRFGPFRDNSALYQIFDFVRGLHAGNLVDVFFDLVTEEGLRDGFAIFLAEEGFASEQIPSVRRLLAWGMRRARLRSKIGEPEDSEAGEEEELPEPEQVAESFRGLFTRAAEEYLRAKRLGRLLNARVSWEAEPGKWRTLQVRNGGLQVNEAPPQEPEFPWASLHSEAYDRMSVLLTELNRFPHRIERGNQKTLKE